jgi:hypothetical protein
MAAALIATAIAATLGAIAHGVDPAVARARRDRFWRAALHAAGLPGGASIASVAFFATTGALRTGLLAFAAAKLVLYTIVVARRPVFRVAALDYGSALAIVLVGACVAFARWRSPGVVWLVAGVGVSLLAGLIQARRLAPHRQFNHNDLYHVVQMAALYLFYRGGVLLVDR